MRRNRSETSTKDDIKAHMSSRKKITKMVNKYIKNLKSFDQNSTALPDIEFGTMLKETEALVFSVLKSALTLISGEKEKSKQRSWSILSKFSQTNRGHSEKDDFCSFDIQEVEEGLESLFRSLIKTRVSLLNVLSH
ncbi:hypothetical protein BUALT_Bualt08G0068800 [Buddleja alternifolia]|uniref:Uncharacterized protein n=1 Tax=Buddleja alternifolia TaxID=168488 RepID=A0AAV6X5J8_9LAMI|nr:hypothetical protein BUALT_Bualt08G0068800 [Buddleja alternifolia]